MAQYATLKAAIDAVIKANGQREITGTVLNQTLNAMVNSLGANYQFAGLATPSTNPGTPDQNVFYLAFEAGTYTNFNATVLSAGISIFMWNGSWSSQTFYTIDATPTASSNNLVSSGAVFDAIKTDGSAYDVSAHFPAGGPNSDGKFTLEYILSNANTLIPAAWRKGGMSIRFVSSSDNKYVQCRYMSSSTTNADFTNCANWQCIDNTISRESQNLVTSGTIYDVIFDKIPYDNGLDGDSSLSFVDENDNCILQAKNGHIKTEKFDSSNSVNQDEDDTDDESVSFVDEGENCIAQFKKGHVKTKNFDSSKITKQFANLTIDDLSFSGSAEKNGNIVNCGGGSLNKAYIDANLQSWHFAMMAKFNCTGTPQIMIGKDFATGGLGVELVGNTCVITGVYNGSTHQYETITSDLGFTLNANEDYCVHVYLDVNSNLGGMVKVIVIGQYDEYFEYDMSDDISNKYVFGHGKPYFYSTSTTCVVKEWNMSVQHYYEVKQAKIMVCGHSFVEAYSLNSQMNKSFTALLEDTIGRGKVVNFGLGGDNIRGLSVELPYYIKMCPNAEYAILDIGNAANDAPFYTVEQMITYLQKCISICRKGNVFPLLVTIIPKSDSIDEKIASVNSWIRNSGFVFIDLEQVAFSSNLSATTPSVDDIKTELYLGDKVHFNVNGHQCIYNRILLDCPYLF